MLDVGPSGHVLDETQASALSDWSDRIWRQLTEERS
jgi:hypothetical protein